MFNHAIFETAKIVGAILLIGALLLGASEDNLPAKKK